MSQPSQAHKSQEKKIQAEINVYRGLARAGVKLKVPLLSHDCNTETLMATQTNGEEEKKEGGREGGERVREKAGVGEGNTTV